MRVPYGYKIVNGKALVDHEEAESLKIFFRKYLDGYNMAEASRVSGLADVVCQTTLPNFLTRPEYVGTDFYPAIITEQEHERLVAERKRQHEEAIEKGMGRRPPKMEVRISKDFTMAAKPKDTEQDAGMLYDRIIPINTFRNGGNEENNQMA